MSLQWTKPGWEFEECPTCKAKPGSTTLCRECLQRRELLNAIRSLAQRFGTVSIPQDLQGCYSCNGTASPVCWEHGR